MLPSANTTNADLARVVAIHERQLALCAALEGIADTLPDAVDHQHVLQVARALPDLVQRAQRLEEDVLFPLLARRATVGVEVEAMLARLRSEHVEDACYAEDIQEALQALGEGRQARSTESLAYMLRGFFSALRRHVAVESDLLATLSRQRAVSDPK